MPNRQSHLTNGLDLERSKEQRGHRYSGGLFRLRRLHHRRPRLDPRFYTRVCYRMAERVGRAPPLVSEFIDRSHCPLVVCTIPKPDPVHRLSGCTCLVSLSVMPLAHFETDEIGVSVAGPGEPSIETRHRAVNHTRESECTRDRYQRYSDSLLWSHPCHSPGWIRLKPIGRESGNEKPILGGPSKIRNNQIGSRRLSSQRPFKTPDWSPIDPVSAHSVVINRVPKHGNVRSEQQNGGCQYAKKCDQFPHEHRCDTA